MKLPCKEDFAGRNPYSKPYTSTASRPEDLPPVGGNKTFTLPAVVPFVASVISDHSAEEFRISVERHFRNVADVTSGIQISLNKLAEALPSIIEAYVNPLIEENTLLKERIKRLEENVRTSP